MAFGAGTLFVVYEVVLNLLLLFVLVLLLIALATLFYPRFTRKKINNSETKVETDRENRTKIDVKKLETGKIQVEKVEKFEEISGTEQKDEITLVK